MTPPETVADAHHRYRGAVERAAARILRDREDASDIASETFLAMLERGPRDRQAALAWLLTTARNRALNLIRNRQRAARRLVLVADVEETPEIADERLASLVAAAMSRLSERDQAAVLLRFVEDCPPEEIAATLGVSVPASRVVVHRAAKRLRIETVRVLAEHHGVEGPCAARLAKLASAGIPAGHDGCAPCSSVTDEISAIAAHSLVPVGAAPLLHNVVARARDAIMSLKPNLGGAESHAAEAFAALLIATGLVAPSIQVADTVPSDAPRPVAPIASVSRTAGAAKTVQRAVAAAKPRVTVPTTLAEDAEGDLQPLVGPPPGINVLGTTIRLPDAFDRSAARGADIRSFAAYTQADESGRPETLVFKLGMADTVARDATFDVAWHFDGTGCTGESSLNTRRNAADDSASFTAYCPTQGLLPLAEEEQEPTYWNFELVPLVRDNVVEIRIPLRDLPQGLEKLLRPNTTLIGLIASSSAYKDLVFAEVDRAPDEDGVRYTIGSD